MPMSKGMKMDETVQVSQYKLDLLLNALRKIEKGVSDVEAGWKGEVREVQNLARLTLARFAAPDP